MRDAYLASRFPGLSASEFRITSPRTDAYNCVAWAFEDQTRWWSPDDFDLYHWPEGIAREGTLAAWEAAFATAGFEPCEDGERESGYDRVAIYARGNEPTHVARQLPNGRWTSKLGRSEDIEHDLAALCGEPGYGEVIRFMRRVSVEGS